ncbi:claudin-10 isoform X3 [Columba livia]|uniref:claudin-10 isoform X3 n=1 Tax=Columba livia TaxID=8932 RepID=UPI0031BAE8C4
MRAVLALNRISGTSRQAQDSTQGQRCPSAAVVLHPQHTRTTRLTCYIQACRGLMISAVCLGFFGAVFGLVGMKCTKVGGSDQTKAKIACLAGLIFILSGLCSMTSCSLYANRITSEFFDPTFVAQKYELGAALFIGWAGASLCIIGGSIFCFSIAENSNSPRRGYAYNGATSVMSSRTKVQNSVPDKTPPKHFDKNAYV